MFNLEINKDDDSVAFAWEYVLRWGGEKEVQKPVRRGAGESWDEMTDIFIDDLNQVAEDLNAEFVTNRPDILTQEMKDQLKNIIAWHKHIKIQRN